MDKELNINLYLLDVVRQIRHLLGECSVMYTINRGKYNISILNHRAKYKPKRRFDYTLSEEDIKKYIPEDVGIIIVQTYKRYVGLDDSASYYFGDDLERMFEHNMNHIPRLD